MTSLPPFRSTLTPNSIVLGEPTKSIAAALDVRGPINVQYAVLGTTVYVIEANPRASRTVPFVAKATGVPLAKIAARIMVGATLQQLRDEGLLRPPAAGGHVSVKEAVLPFNRFPDVDTILGPEMRATGEVMGIDSTFGMAFAKSQLAAGNGLPTEGAVFFSLALVAELRSGRLRAALDVTEPEPLPEGHPLWSAPGLLLTPHVAGAVPDTNERAAAAVVDQIRRVLEGRPLVNVVADY